jgi:hypothetical protein
MATQKFSDLTTTTTPNSASVFAIAYNGSSLGVTLSSIAANLPATTATSITTSGNATIGGDLTITGDDLFMNTNTSGAALIADGTNFNPVVISGDLTISTSGVAAIGSGVIINADVNASAAIAFSKMANLTASRLLVSDGNGDVSVSAVTSTEAGYLDTVSSNIQTQLNAKAASNYVPTTITVADESSDTTCFPLFTTAATGDLGPKSASGLTFNASTDVLSGTFAGNITGNVTGNTSGTSGSTTGNAATATSAATLTTARNIGGVSFNGSVNINLPGVNTAGSQNTSGTAAGLSATLAVGSGGSGATSLTANGVLIGNGASAVTAVDMSTKGKILIGDGSGNPQMLSIGSNGQVLTAASGETTGVTWAATSSTITPPTISGVSPSTIENTATNVTISGGNFVTIPGVEAQASTGAIVTANTVTFTNISTLVANFTLPVDGTYFIRVENPDGLAVRSSSAILTVSDAPTWNTTSGTLGSFAAGASVSASVSASGDATLAYSKVSGSFPGGCSINSSTGAITGTESGASASTTYNFTLRVTDGQSQTADRAFSITIEVGMANSMAFN